MKRPSPPSAAGRAPRFRLYFDGGSRGNPGPAYGSYRIQLGDAAPEPAVRESFGHGSNNMAEYRALIAGLRGLRQRLQADGLAPEQISLEVLGDSMLVVEQMSGRWRVKDRDLRLLWEQATDLTRDVGSVRFVRQPRRRSVSLLGH